MADYTAQTWANDAGGGTPLSAARLNTLEGGAASSVQQSGNDSEMTGELLLPNASPTVDNAAARKKYVDDQDTAHTGATSVHSATAAATADRIVLRDGSGRAAVADPSASGDIATKTYVDTGNATRFADIDYQVFTASGTWTKPADAVKVYVELVGAGGGGGGVLSNTGCGGGGGGGAYVAQMFDAGDLAATEAVTVGGGGSGTTTTGGNGDASVFDTIAGSLSADGGDGGTTTTGGSSGNANGGVGGTASGGDVNIDGTSGSDGQWGLGPVFFGGGGMSGRAFGSGHKAFIVAGTNANGQDGIGYGGGGAGSVSETSATTTGGDGTDGICIVTTYTA